MNINKEEMEELKQDGRKYLEYMKENGGLHPLIQNFLDAHPEACGGIGRSWTNLNNQLNINPSLSSLNFNSLVNQYIGNPVIESLLTFDSNLDEKKVVLGRIDSIRKDNDIMNNPSMGLGGIPKAK